jgi:hypothetical protein
MLIIADIEGIPAVAARLDKMQQALAGPMVRKALEEGGEILRAQAEENVHKLTGTLAADIDVKVGIFKESLVSYAVIGPGWDPTSFRWVTNRSARNRDAAPEPDQTTNPGVYGYFLEVGHRAPGLGLAHNAEYQRAARFSRKQGKMLNTYTNPSSRDYGHLSTPPYPWLLPAAEEKGEAAMEQVGFSLGKSLEASEGH